MVSDKLVPTLDFSLNFTTILLYKNLKTKRKEEIVFKLFQWFHFVQPNQTIQCKFEVSGEVSTLNIYIYIPMELISHYTNSFKLGVHGSKSL